VEAEAAPEVEAEAAPEVEAEEDAGGVENGAAAVAGTAEQAPADSDT
jgi:hypothetical protein